MFGLFEQCLQTLLDPIGGAGRQIVEHILTQRRALGAYSSMSWL